MPDRTASASFGPMPLIADQPFEELLFERRRESVQRDDLLAHVRVDRSDTCAPASPST